MTFASESWLGMAVLARDELTVVMSVGARTILVGAGIMSVSSDSDIVMLPGASGLNPGSYALRRAPPYRIQKEIRPGLGR